MTDKPNSAEILGTETSPEHAKQTQQILVLRDFCTRLRGADCGRCALACPHDAIYFDGEDKPTIDAKACTHCGICLGICDAFTSSRVTMIDLHARIRRIALRGEEVVLTCKENVFPGLEPAANVVVLPCLAALSPEFWTLVLSENIPVTIAADLAYCVDCDRAGELGEMLFGHAIETAEAWSGKTVGARDAIPERENLVRDFANPDGVDRRGAFENLVSDVSDIASGKRRLRNSDVLQQFYERRERARALTRLNLADDTQFNNFAPSGRTHKVLWPKRQMLLEAIDRNPTIATRVPVVVSDTNYDRCMSELVCAAACPTKARFPNPESGALDFDVRYCIGCGLCVAACPHSAVQLLEATAEVLVPREGDGAPLIND